MPKSSKALRAKTLGLIVYFKQIRMYIELDWFEFCEATFIRREFDPLWREGGSLRRNMSLTLHAVEIIGMKSYIELL